MQTPDITPTIYYDSHCGLCSAGRRRLERIMLRRGWKVVAMDDPGVPELLGLEPGETPGENKVRTTDGRILGGVDAYGYIWRHVWWAVPLSWLTRVPGIRQVVILIYRTIAKHRNRISATCGLRPDRPMGKSS